MLTTSQKLYVKYIAFSLLIVGSLALIQFEFVYDGNIHPKYILIPLIVSTIMGYLLAKQRLLKDDNENQKHQFESIVEMADEVAYLQTPKGHYNFISSGISRLTGYDREDFYRTPYFFETLIVDPYLNAWKNYYQQLTSSSSTEDNGILIQIRRKNDTLIWIRHRAKPIVEADQITLYSAMNIDVSDQVQQEKAVQKLAIEDQLTNLPNRRALEEKVTDLITRQQPFYLAMMDLNRFKSINDSMGHSFGDILLVEIANRLDQLTGNDICVVRFGGDEFVFIIQNHLSIQQTLDTIHQLITTPINIQGFDLEVSGSFGYVQYPNDAQDFETLVRYADAAMYQAKQSIGSNLMRYEGDAIQVHERTMFIEHNLHKAIQNGDIQPHFQPIYDISGKEIKGVECLARWHDPDLGWITPDEFIAIAEVTNLISALGDSILSQSLNFAKQVNQNRENPIQFSVNVSVKQLMEKQFDQNVIRLLEKRQVPASLLKIEVTESLFLGQSQHAIKVLKTLRNFGVQVSLDDFGTGYSALSVLNKAQLDEIKLDKSFIHTHDHQSYALIEHLINLSHVLGFSVVAEGIETESQLSKLQALNCDKLQGYLLSKPLDKQHFLALLEKL